MSASDQTLGKWLGFCPRQNMIDITMCNRSSSPQCYGVCTSVKNYKNNPNYECKDLFCDGGPKMDDIFDLNRIDVTKSNRSSSPQRYGVCNSVKNYNKDPNYKCKDLFCDGGPKMDDIFDLRDDGYMYNDPQVDIKKPLNDSNNTFMNANMKLNHSRQTPYVKRDYTETLINQSTVEVEKNGEDLPPINENEENNSNTRQEHCADRSTFIVSTASDKINYQRTDSNDNEDTEVETLNLAGDMSKSSCKNLGEPKKRIIDSGDYAMGLNSRSNSASTLSETEGFPNSCDIYKKIAALWDTNNDHKNIWQFGDGSQIWSGVVECLDSPPSRPADPKLREDVNRDGAQLLSELRNIQEFYMQEYDNCFQKVSQNINEILSPEDEQRLDSPLSRPADPKLREEVDRDGDELLYEVRQIQEFYMQDYIPVPKVSQNICEILSPQDQQCCHSKVATHVDNLCSFATRFEENCFIRVPTLTKFRSAAL